MSSDTPTPTPPPAATPPPANPPGNIVLAAIGYVFWPLALVTILIEKSNRDIRFHGFNGLFYFLAYVVVSLALVLVSMILGGVPGVGRLLRMISGNLWILYLVFGIIFAVKAYNRKPVEIPMISEMARKQAG